MKDTINKSICDSLNKLNIKYDEEIEISTPKQKENGDYSSNIALKLTKKLQKNPMDIANEIVANISNDEINKIEIKKPGFINFFVKK